MKLFFSHSSSDKSRVREIRRCLPSHLSSWFDEEDLEVGSDMSRSIKRAIDSEVDLVVACLTPKAAKSKWVRDELEWALEREKQMDRVFVIPIVFGLNYKPPKFSHRLYIRCYDDSKEQIEIVANKLYTEVVKLAFETIAKYESQNPTSDLAMRLCGNWTGTVHQIEGYEIPTDYGAEMTIAQIRNQIVGKFVCDFPDGAKEFRFTGKLSFDRFLQIEYSSMSPNVAQLGSVLYTIGREGRVLSGKFIGYTPDSDRIVTGHTTATKRA